MERNCPICGMVPVTVTLCDSGPHYAKLTCSGCGAFQGWQAKPDSDASKYRRPASHRELVRKYGQGHCELCTRPEGELNPKHGLIGHHVVPFKDGGTDDRDNVWILCTACHALVHWMRTYNRPSNIQPESPDETRS